MFGQITSYADPTTHAERLVQLDGVVEIAATVGGILSWTRWPCSRACHLLAPPALRRPPPVRQPWQGRGRRGHQRLHAEDHQGVAEPLILGAYNDGYRAPAPLQEAFSTASGTSSGAEEAIEKQLIKSPVIRRMGITLRAAYETKAISTPVGTKALEGFTATFFEHGRTTPSGSSWACSRGRTGQAH